MQELTLSDMSSPIYRRVAAHWMAAMEQGTLPAGARLPSVRQLCEQHGISLTTAVAVYRWLEDQGWVEARPKSGYFVAHRRGQLPEPRQQAPLDAPQMVGLSERVMRFLDASRTPDVVSLGAACPGPDLFPVATLQRLLNQEARRQPEALSRYTLQAGGEMALRVQIARRAASYGLHLNPEDIIVTFGCTEALNLALRVVTRPGDTVAIESPSYYGLLRIIEALGLRVLEIPTHPRDGISLEALELATRVPGAVSACLFITNFNNPLGSLMPADNKQRLVRLLAERSIPLIEDDIYGDLYLEGSRPPVAKSWDRGGNVLLCGSFTKCLAPGLRTGWIAPGRFLRQVEMLKFQNTVATTTLPQLVIARYMESGGFERHLRRLREQFRLQVARVSACVERYFPPGTCITRPAGGFVLWVELPRPLTGQQLFTRALQRGVVIVPGDLFSTQSLYDGCIRINCGLPWSASIEAGLRTVGVCAHELLGG